MRLLIIGLDSAPPSLLFDRYLEVMPNLAEMLDSSLHGPLKTCHPPITVPAWAVMATGKTPGELGIYGFRHRRPGDYQDYYIVTSKDVREPFVWDLLAEKGYRSLLTFFPPSYPPMQVKGLLISDFHTPSDAKNYTFPPWLRLEVERLLGRRPTFDVKFRVEDRKPLERQLFAMTEEHFLLLEHLLKKNWDLAWHVEIGLDRLHHAFWKFFDPSHPRHPGENEFQDVAERYYALLDELIARVRRAAGNPVTLVVSDHGAKAMEGAFAINQWLEEVGLLTFKERPQKQTRFERAKVDWERTKAWGWGGYYARIFVNLKGREPQGVVNQEDYQSFLGELKDLLKGVTKPDGSLMGVEAYTPHELYPEVRGDYPDLMVYLGNLSWRSAGTVGHPTTFLEENDTGPDDAVHDWEGVYMLHDPEGRFSGEKEASIYDIAPTILKLFGLTVGRSLI